VNNTGLIVGREFFRGEHWRTSSSVYCWWFIWVVWWVDGFLISTVIKSSDRAFAMDVDFQILEKKGRPLYGGTEGKKRKLGPGTRGKLSQ